MRFIDPVVHGVACGLLAWVMAAAAWHKWVRGPAFRAALASYGLLPARLVAPAAVALAAAESGAAIGLLWPATASRAALLSASLLLVYSAAIALALAAGRAVPDCGCSGPAAVRPLAPGLLVRNAALGVIALLAAAPVAPRPVGAFDLVSGFAAVVVAVLILHSAEHAAANAGQQREDLRRAGDVA